MFLFLSISLPTFAQSNGIFESYAILSIKGGANAYYDMQASTGNPDFQGADLGSFTNVESLVVKGGQNKTYKCDGGDITGGNLFWRVYRTVDGPSGAFTSLTMNHASDDLGGCGHQTWEANSGVTNLISSLSIPGNYTLEIYTEAYGSPTPTSYSSNGGLNYKATFTYTGDAANPINVTSSAGSLNSARYATLNAAFAALNNGTHQGVISIAISGNTTNSPATAVLNSSGAGSANYTSLKIFPTLDNITISGSTNSGFGVIELNGADNVTIDGDNPETAGINRNLTVTNTAAATTTYTMAIRIAVDQTVATTANNITIKNINANGSATGRNTSSFTSTTGSENNSYGIYAGHRNVTTAATNAPAAISSTSTTVTGSATFQNLIIDNNVVNACARAIMVQSGVGTVAPGLQVTNNIIGAATLGSTTTVYSYGIGVQGSTDGIVRGNIIRSLESYLGTSIRAISIGDIQSVATDSFIIDNNIISNVINSNTGAWAVYGININGGIGHQIINNFIYNINAFQGNSNTSTGYVVRGIRINSGSNHKAYHNSVYLSGALLGGSVADTSACFGITSASYTGLDVRNNIFSNTQTGLAGTNIMCVQLPSGASSSFNLTLNNNAYYTGSASNNFILGLTSGTNYTAANFSAAVTTPSNNSRAYTSLLNAAGTNDNASYASANTPPFISTTNLHLNTSSSEIINVESKGANLSVAKDIDGDSRGTTPDIGADEVSVAPVANDAGISAIPVDAYTCPSVHNVVVTLKNFGTNTLTSATINWSVNGTPQSSYSWSGSLAAGATTDVTIGTYNFSQPVNTIVSSTTLPNGTTDGNTGNDSKTSAAFKLGLSGTYTVGVGKDFTTLTAAVAHANTTSLCGPTVFSLTDANYTSETFPISILNLQGSSTTNTLTIKPATGVNATIAGNYALSILDFNGTKNIIVDGSNVVNGTTKNLTIRNNNTTSGIGLLIRNGSTDNLFKNTNIQTAQTDIIGSVSFTAASASSGNNNNIVRDNKIGPASSLATISVMNAGTAGFPNTNNQLVNNEILDFSLNGVYDFGYSSGFTIDGNSIHGSASQITSSSISVIYLKATTIENPKIINNKIYDIRTSTTSGSLAGINLYDVATGTSIIVYNNMISLSGNGANAPSAIWGIIDQSEGNTFLYHNTVHIYGAATFASESDAYNKYFTGTSTLYNNSFTNVRTSTGTGKQSAINWKTTAGGNIISNYNNIYSKGNTNNTTGIYNDVDKIALLDWQTATSKDANSITTLPIFASNLDLHIATSGCSFLESAGTPLVAVTTDIDNEPRSATTPDIGADEFSGNIPPALPTVTDNSNCGQGTVILSANSADPNVTGYNWYSNPTGGSPLNGATPTGNNWETPTIAATTIYYVSSYNGNCESVERVPVTATILPSATAVQITEIPNSSGATLCDLNYVELNATGGIITTNITSGTGTSTTSGSSTLAALGPNPLQNYYGGAKQQWIYQASELTALGFKANAKIKSIALTLATANASLVLQNLTVKMKNTTKSAFSSTTNWETDMITVRNSANYTPATGKNTITLDTPFIWNGTDNLIIEVYYTNNNSPTTGTNTAKYSSTTFSSTLFYRADNITNAAMSAYTGAASFSPYSSRNDVVFEIEDQQITWSPAEGLYKDPALTEKYVADTFAEKVYAAPTVATSYTAKAKLGSCEKTATTVQPIVTEKFIFTQKINNSWNNEENWKPYSIPDITKCVNIPDGKTVNVDITAAEAKTLNISENGKLIIPADKVLTVKDKITIVNNVTNDNLVIESDGSLIQQDNVSNSGNVLVKRNAKLPKMGYTFWSAPVASQNLYAFSDGYNQAATTGTGTPWNRFFLYDEKTDEFKNTGAFLLNSLSVFQPASGYAIRGMNNFSANPDGKDFPVNPYEFKFNGVPNNGDIAFTQLKWTDNNHGYNLIGNPYPSNINFDDFYELGNNENMMYATAYFWTNNDMAVTAQQGSGYEGNNYAVYNKTGGSPAIDPDIPDASTEAPDGVIKVGQGFIIRSKQAGTLNFDNTIRVKDAGTFYNTKATRDRFWLTLSTPENITNTILLGYISEATNNAEVDYDAELFTVGSDSFYSLLDNTSYAIQGRSYPLNVKDIVPLGARFFQSGMHTIKLKDPEGIFVNGQSIYLKDKELNIMTDLSKGNYTFSANAGTFDNRFEIVYEPAATMGTDNTTLENITVYRDAADFVVRSSAQKIKLVEVYDASGRLILKLSAKANEVRIPAQQLINGMFVVKAQLADGRIVNKKVRK